MGAVSDHHATKELRNAWISASEATPLFLQVPLEPKFALTRNQLNPGKGTPMAKIIEGFSAEQLQSSPD